MGGYDGRYANCEQLGLGFEIAGFSGGFGRIGARAHLAAEDFF